MDIIDDIRARMKRMPIFVGVGTTVPVLPAPEQVSDGTWVYQYPFGWLEAVREPSSTLNYAVKAPPLGS